jgi:hypothetical protein
MRVDDARVVGVGFRVIAKELDQRLLRFDDEGVRDGSVAKTIAEDGRTGINWIRSFMRRYRKERL